MATAVLIHGAGDTAWSWHLLAVELRERGHDVVAMDLPCDDELAGLAEYAETVVDAIGDRTDLVVVAHSFGGYTAPLVCDRIPVALLVLVAGMVPTRAESAQEMFASTGYEPAVQGDDGDLALFYHDLPPSLAAEALAKRRHQAETPWREPWPLAAWPNVPTRYLLCRDDRVLPAPWTRHLVRNRLGIAPDDIDGGHYPALGRPRELADRLDAYRAEVNRAERVGRGQRERGAVENGPAGDAVRRSPPPRRRS